MDRFDEVFSVLTEDQGWSEENARKIMVYCAEQGMNPVEAAARFVGGMAGLPTVDMRKSFFNPWNMFPKKPQPQKGLPKTGPSSSLPTQKALPPARPIATPNQTQGMLGSRSVPTSKELGQAPVPQFGPDKARPKIGPATPPTAYEKIRPPADAGIKARTALNTPKPPAPKPAFNASSAVKGALNPRTLGGKLGFAGMALGAVDQAQKVFNPKDNLFTSIKDLATSIRHGGKVGPGHSRYRAPESDPALPRTPKPQPVQKAVEPVKTEPVKRSAPKLSAAAKDFDKTFAAARAAGEKEFTWRGKRYNTKYKSE